MYYKLLLFLISCGLMSFMPVRPLGEMDYEIVHRFHLEGDGFWDYCTVDDATGLLFVSHNTVVQVVNINTGKTVATIKGVNGVHGIALAPKLNRGYISSGRDSKVLVFNLKTFATISTIKTTGNNPDCILFEPFTNRVFTFNGRSANSTVIDAKTLKVIGTIPLDGKPEFARSDGAGNVYVNIEDKSEITRLNPVSLKVVNVWSISPGEEPSGLALDKANHRLFSVCRNKMMVIVNADNGKVIKTLPTGEHTDGCVFDPVTQRAYSSNGEGTLTVVQELDPDSFNVLGNMITQAGARTIAVDVKTHHLFLPTASFKPAPKASTDNPHPRPSLVPGSFTVLDIAPSL